MQYAGEFLYCLENLDIEGIKRLWSHVSPHLPQPETDAEALATLHYARTQTNKISFQKRAYSHQWLTNEGLPSGLPDNLKPKAERIYPVIKSSVGIAIKMTSPDLEPVGILMRKAMEDAVMECYEDGKIMDSELVKTQMAKARKKSLRQLLGK